jgi:hypothetical protein
MDEIMKMMGVYQPPSWYYYTEGKKKGQLNPEKALMAPPYSLSYEFCSCRLVSILFEHYGTRAHGRDEEGQRYLLYVHIGMSERNHWKSWGYRNLNRMHDFKVE